MPRAQPCQEPKVPESNRGKTTRASRRWRKAPCVCVSAVEVALPGVSGSLSRIFPQAWPRCWRCLTTAPGRRGKRRRINLLTEAGAKTAEWANRCGYWGGSTGCSGPSMEPQQCEIDMSDVSRDDAKRFRQNFGTQTGTGSPNETRANGPGLRLLLGPPPDDSLKTLAREPAPFTREAGVAHVTVALSDAVVHEFAHRRGASRRFTMIRCGVSARFQVVRGRAKPSRVTNKRTMAG